MIEKNQKTEQKYEFGIDQEEMLKAGLHFGHRTSKLHPKMKPFIFGVRNTLHIIDLEKTAEKLESALKFIQKMAEEKKVFLFVGTKIQHKEVVERTAKDCNSPYVTERWLGGTLSNFKIMRKRIDYLKELEEKKESEVFRKYTKKEQKNIEKEIKNLKIKFGGIETLEKLPDILFVCDIIKDELAVREAKAKKIPIVAICDTNSNPDLVDYPIPANNNAQASVEYILDKIKKVISK